LADVFISYSRLDHERVQPIADRLTSLGYSIWWDKHLRAGQVFVDEIERQSDSAKALLDGMERKRANSTWVVCGIEPCARQHKFLQLRLDNARLPLPFEALQVADMSGGKAEWGTLGGCADALGAPIAGRRPPLERLPRAGALATPRQRAPPSCSKPATPPTLVAYSAAVSRRTWLMTADQLQVACSRLGSRASGGGGGSAPAVTAQRLLSIRRAGLTDGELPLQSFVSGHARHALRSPANRKCWRRFAAGWTLGHQRI